MAPCDFVLKFNTHAKITALQRANNAGAYFDPNDSHDRQKGTCVRGHIAVAALHSTDGLSVDIRFMDIANALFAASSAVLFRALGADCLPTGDGISHQVHMCEGYELQHDLLLLDLAGRDRADLVSILSERDFSCTTSAEREIVRDVEEKLAYVAEDYDAKQGKTDTSSDLEKNYELPDGQVTTLGAERLRCTEVLFKPTPEYSVWIWHRVFRNELRIQPEQHSAAHRGPAQPEGECAGTCTCASRRCGRCTRRGRLCFASVRATPCRTPSCGWTWRTRPEASTINVLSGDLAR